MKPRRLSIPLAIFLLLTSAAIAFFIYCGQDFPPTMVIGFGGAASAWHVDRVKFIVLGSFLSLMLPTFVITVIGVLPRVLARERRTASLDTMLWAGLWLGCLVQALLMLVNIAIYRANLR